RFRTPARDAGIAVGAVADEREPVRYRGRWHAELRNDAGLVKHPAPRSVEADDASAAHTLRQVLVGRADHDTLDAGRQLEPLRRSRERVVTLELDHGPRHEPERAARVLDERKLGEQVGLDTLARLVAGVEIVAERFDDMVERDRDVRDVALSEQGQHRAQHAADGTDLAAVGARARRAAVIRAKQLERAVDEMYLHDTRAYTAL